MYKISLDTTTAKLAKVTLTKSGDTISEIQEESPLPAIRNILSKNKIQLSQIDEFESNPGPGSYTGIRIGAVIVATLSFALGKKSSPIEPIYD